MKVLTLLLVHLQGDLMSSAHELNLSCLPPTLGICIESLESICNTVSAVQLLAYIKCIAGSIHHLRWGEVCLRLRLHLP